MVMRRIGIGAMVAGLCFLGACEPVQPTTPTTPADPAAPPPATAPRTEPGVGVTERDQAIQPLTLRLERLRTELDQLRLQAEQVPQQNRAEFETVMGNAQSAYSNAVLHIDRMRQAQGAQFTMMRDEADPILQELEASIQQARNLVQGEQPGMGQPGMDDPGQQPQQPQDPQQPPPGTTGGA